MKKQQILVILGPTASGKSDLGVIFAKKFNGEIISADSRQVYRGLDVGSGKITKKEMLGIPHYLLDVSDPKKTFTVADYKKQAEKALDSIIGKEKLPIIVGGTGFYIDTLIGSVEFPNVPPNPKLRKELETRPTEKLFELLKKKDPARAKTIDPHNKIRLVRALEIVETLGKVPTLSKKASPYKPIYIGIKPDNLDERILVRLEKRMPGIIKEIKRLHEEGVSWKRMYELGLEYRYVSLYVRGKISKKEMFETLYKEIKQFSKRQMTWFKRNKNIKWFKPEEAKKIEKYLKEKI